MCDRWFGYFVESMRVLGLLDDTMVIFTSDQGHSLGERDYVGKRGYPSEPAVIEIPLIVRFPGGEHAGTTSDMFVQHHDIAAAILEAADVAPPTPIDGVSFLEEAVTGRPGSRDHATVGYSAGITVVTDQWWFNGKVDGTGPLLYDLRTGDPFAANVAAEHPDVVRALFGQAEADAHGVFPNWVVELARNEADAPGCSELAARE
jgi:arylsulfatase A-like enzyme